MNDNQHSIGRRPVLKTAGMTLAGLGGLANSVAAGKGNRSLENTPSIVDFGVFVGLDRTGNGGVNEFGDFGFPVAPAFGGTTDGTGPLPFNTTRPEVTPGGQAIHYALQFIQGALLVNKPKPYVVTHTDDGRYQSRGAVVNFKVGENPPPPFNLLTPPTGPLVPGNYRAVAHDEIELYEKGGNFDWSATRAEFYKRGKGGIDHKVSLLYLVWDEDGPDHNQTGDRANIANPTSLYSAIPTLMETAEDLIRNGKLNPGGQ